MPAPPKVVRRRKVFYLPGYDPFPARRYRELYRTEGAKQAEISEYGLRVEAAGDDGAYSWRASGVFDGVRVESEFEVLTWSDIVQDSMSNSIPATYWQLIRTSWTYIASGTLRRLALLPKGPLIAALYPIAVLLLQLIAALLAAHLVGWTLSTVFQALVLWALGEGAIARWGQALLYWTPFFVIAVLVLRWFRAQDHKLYTYYLMHDYAFSAGRKGATPPALQQRLDDFRATIAIALLQDYDEVLVVGHSSGAHLGVSILADLLRDHPTLPSRPALSFLSLGHVIPMVSFLPKAYKLRTDLRFLSQRDEITWVDVTAPGDGCSYALCDPVAVTGLETAEKRWPLVFSAQFSRTMAPERYEALRRKYFKLHFQYLCAFEQPLDYDYFQITAGPLTLGTRYADRPPSKSRIDVPVSKYTSTGP
ncbi:hypothetical protein [Marivita hallyeonensis]|uniref:Lipase (Class 3) n=1 Tax=Marivita hallyeonensis TaxID=996342 RepID=A0A1M5VY41_9RHOB|nr:hypothetical protein [Marivita hallyeonensis]SHH80202.1 hypothetical protein SAMN05443551_3149 [Marivita hallyeonensis]